MSRATEVAFDASDGWPIGAVLRTPDDRALPPGAGVVTVPASRHERDAWTQVATKLTQQGITVLQIDVHGRGASTHATPYSSMGPAQRRRVALDVSAAIGHLAGVAGVDPVRLGLLVEHDTAADALEAVAEDARVTAIGVLSARHPGRVAPAVEQRGAPVYGLVSIEDREGLRATVDAYLAAPTADSRIDVFRGLGVGITMASVLQFERPAEQQIDDRLAGWFNDVLG